jgi:acyl-CoA thioesterase
MDRQAHAGRTGIYDAKVSNQKGELIAVFRGKSATVKGKWVE